MVLLFLGLSSAVWIALAVLDWFLPADRPRAAWQVSYSFAYRDGRYEFVSVDAVPLNADGPTPSQIAELRQRWGELHIGSRSLNEVRVWAGLGSLAEDYSREWFASKAPDPEPINAGRMWGSEERS